MIEYRLQLWRAALTGANRGPDTAPVFHGPEWNSRSDSRLESICCETTSPRISPGLAMRVADLGVIHRPRRWSG